MDLDQTTQRELKEVELGLFRAFIECCDRLGLRYYLMGGTMLGAVRHQGFIPWDDDIDVGMPREDFQVFVQEGQKLLPPFYFVQTVDTDRELLTNICKLRDSRTAFIETSTKDCNINHGVFIDIFPLDYYPESKLSRAVFDLKNRALTMRIRSEFTLADQNKKSGAMETAAKIASKLVGLRYRSAHDAIKARERLFRSVRPTSLMANYMGAWGKKEIVPADWYGDGAWGTFEGLRVRLPAKYDLWLRQVYGDYMKLPPVEKRVSHHYNEVIDLKRPYTDYITGGKKS